MGRYFGGWFDQFRAVASLRNTMVCSFTVCIVVFVMVYHKVYITLPSRCAAVRRSMVRMDRSLAAMEAWSGASISARAVPQGILFLAKGRQYRRIGQQVFHIEIFLALPMLSWAVMRKPVNRFGIRVGNWRVWIVDVLAAWAVMVVLIVVFARGKDFMQMYPLFKPARDSWRVFFWYQLLQLTYMFTWEFLYRGYMLFGTEKEIGRPAAVILSMIPFAILHIGKPELEAYGSILAGIYLGVMALRANSMLPCAILHFLAAFSMDLFAVLMRR